MYAAAWPWSRSAVKLLISKGANRAAKSNVSAAPPTSPNPLRPLRSPLGHSGHSAPLQDGETALDIAIRTDSTDIIELLKDTAEEALFKAVKEGDLTTLKGLVEEGVSVNAKDAEVSATPPALLVVPLSSTPRHPALCCPALTARH